MMTLDMKNVGAVLLTLAMLGFLFGTLRANNLELPSLWILAICPAAAVVGLNFLAGSGR